MNVLVVTGSVRGGRVADNVLNMIKEEAKKHESINLQVADVAQLPMSFFDAPVSPSSEDFAPTDKNVQAFTKMVANADAVILLTPEYNHSYTPVLKNAIDWVYEEWQGKPVGYIGYGWVGGARAIKHLRDVMASNINASSVDEEANLRFMKVINVDGSAIDADVVSAEISKVLDAVTAAVSELVEA